MDTLTLLRQEINMTQGQEHDLAKWKLAVTAVLGAVAFGLSKDNTPKYWLLFFVPFVCAYVDLYAYQYQLRILVIAKFFRGCHEERVLQAYEKECEAVRKAHGFDLGIWAGIGSSLCVSTFGPIFYFLRPSLGTIPDTLLVPPAAAGAIWLVGVILIIYLFWDFLRKKREISN
jgi:hypothetical protein